MTWPLAHEQVFRKFPLETAEWRARELVPQLTQGQKSTAAPEAAPENRIAPNAKQRLAPFWAAISRGISSL